MAMSTDALAGVTSALEQMQPFGAVMQALEYASAETNRYNHDEFCGLVDQVCDYVTANHLAGTAGFTSEDSVNMLVSRACVLSANENAEVQAKADAILAHIGGHFTSTLNTFYGMAWEHYCREGECHEGFDAGKEHFNAMTPKARQELMDNYLQLHGGSIFQTYFQEYSEAAESVGSGDVDGDQLVVDSTTDTDSHQPRVVDDTNENVQPPVSDDSSGQQPPLVDDSNVQPQPVLDESAAVVSQDGADHRTIEEQFADFKALMEATIQGLEARLNALENPSAV